MEDILEKVTSIDGLKILDVEWNEELGEPVQMLHSTHTTKSPMPPRAEIEDLEPMPPPRSVHKGKELCKASIESGI